MSEWLEADGRGGFAMGEADGIRTRRYHALLLAATNPPGGRMTLVNDVEVYAETAAGSFGLSSHSYGGGHINPDGATRIARFVDDPWPRWEYALPDGTRIAYEIVVANAVTVQRWTLLAGAPCRLIVRPFLSGRDFHAMQHENPAFQFTPRIAGSRLTWTPYDGVPAIHCFSHGTYRHEPAWYRGFHYVQEYVRGLDADEDLACPGAFELDLREPQLLAWSTSPVDHAFVHGAFDAERERRAEKSRLERRADQFVVARGTGKTIIAGYPWFGDWGRDTFISLRGLCATRPDDARAILGEWAKRVDRGMLPNRFADDGQQAEFNSVDAALWFCVAAHAFGGDELRPAIRAIVSGYRDGTRHNIRMDRDDKLIACGEPGLQLTWMDAVVDGEVITPRIGKPVEIQALWINALEIAGEHELAVQARTWFAVKFWDSQRGRLYDVIDCDGERGKVDASLRPNQIFPIGGLPHQLLDGDQARLVVDTCFRELWTPAGPRSLSPFDPRYVPHYRGNQRQRDRAYHNGTVWPWLAGPFIEAWARVYRDPRAAREKFLAPLLARDCTAEICDADAPHTPAGCPFQAWSVGELLRLDRTL